ncbi:hypothetical protein EDB92DRAFT_1817588 [Lactarius akahatsu]|uniref:Uncharacterized protein n=1 Tax=Lactarius akahatsu TaxID=416441 RepID=A0AAD4QC29_9AGAM|nr:hypothetical protein EDB92DRAFT_1817588 [Lactarius akahatsu]
MRIPLLLLLAHSVFAGEWKRKWCGKEYRAGQPISPPGGHFPFPVTTTTPQLVLRCNAALMPFLPDDLVDNSSSLILVDALVRYKEIAGAQPLIIPSSPDVELFVNVSVDGMPLTSGTVSLNGSAAIPFSLSAISPRSVPYSLGCTATLSSSEQNFTSTPTKLVYLPSPPDSIGSITKLDQRTGGLLAKRAFTQDPYEPIFPVGFYTQFGGYLEGNDGVLEVLKRQGINVVRVHPIPPYDDLTAFNRMVDKMEELGLWLMYDMRWSYMNSTSVTEQVISLRDRTNLLLYYTADEPDGSQDPLAAPASAATLINSLDPYRPSSLVLNCQDYFFSDYAAGTPILMQDAYPIGINPNYSVVYDTPCTTEHGCCGCDNCVGKFEDIRNRMDDFAMRLEVLGWERSKSIWTVPQGFGSAEFWSRTPTYTEFLVQMIVAVNAGARGSISWTDPTTPDIKAATSQFTSALPELTPFLLSSPLSSPPVHFARVITPDRLDFGVWVSSRGEALVMAANLNYFPLNVVLDEVLSATQFKWLGLVDPRLVVDGGARIVGTRVTFGSVRSGAWIFRVIQSSWWTTLRMQLDGYIDIFTLN